MLERFKLGQIVNVVGLKGEVRVYPYTDYKERFSELDWLFVETQVYEIEKVRYMGDMAVVKFKGVDDRNSAEKLKIKYLYIDRKNARELPKDTYFIADLVGSNIVDEQGTLLGVLSDIIQNTAQDLYEVENTQKQKFFIPAVEEFVKNVNIKDKVITVSLIEGMMDI